MVFNGVVVRIRSLKTFSDSHFRYAIPERVTFGSDDRVDEYSKPSMDGDDRNPLLSRGFHRIRFRTR